MLGVASVVVRRGVLRRGVRLHRAPAEPRAQRLLLHVAGLVLVLVGVTTLLPAATASTGVLRGARRGVRAAWSRIGRLFLLLHAAAYIVAAGIVSGTLSYASGRWWPARRPPWTLPERRRCSSCSPPALAAWLAAREPRATAAPAPAWPRFVIVLVLSCCRPAARRSATSRPPWAACRVRHGGRRACWPPSAPVVLALAALVVAWIGRHARLPRVGLARLPAARRRSALKMVAQDFMHSRPATLFVALALYGAALIVAPRLRRRQA